MTMAVSQDGWTLDESQRRDIDALMEWFPNKCSIEIWGGPEFRYPFTRHSFFEDVYWGRMASFSLRDSSGNFVAFGQLYERLGRINLARLVVHPAKRDQGVGKRLIEMLMTASGPLFDCAEYSLFVFRENKNAYECYKSMGFAVTDYPHEVPHADTCYYLTRPVTATERGHA